MATWMRIAAVCFFMAASAHADGPVISMQAAGKTVNLLLPERTCAYDRSQKADARILDAMEKANPQSQMLLAFIDCGNLNALRDVKDATYGPGYYGQILSDIAGQTVTDNYTREAYVKAAAAQYGGEPPAKAMDRGEEMFTAMASGAATESAPKTIGVIKQTRDFFQLAVMGSQKTPAGGLQNFVNIVTLTKLGVPVSITIGHPLTAGMTLHDFSNRTELYTRQLLALNPEEAPPFANGIDKWSFLLGAAVGTVFMLIAVFISRGSPS